MLNPNADLPSSKHFLDPNLADYETNTVIPAVQSSLFQINGLIERAMKGDFNQRLLYLSHDKFDQEEAAFDKIKKSGKPISDFTDEELRELGLEVVQEECRRLLPSDLASFLEAAGQNVSIMQSQISDELRSAVSLANTLAISVPDEAADTPEKYLNSEYGRLLLSTKEAFANLLNK